MEKRRDIYQAIADPTRREIISLIARQSMNLNAIADNFDASRPAISQHIKVLTECGLIMIKKQGRERYCELKIDRLIEVTSWVEQCRKYWNETIDSMENYLQELQTKNKKNGKQ
ncbi:ArsR/SmtB family transcription factor [Chitinophaga qingshengii]|uniref:Winged helix-turn-helix transcriptional regulator n=1 Tax=Chitinophaga qingshengii TaxID=1569794 RepID=A0ABR7TFN6_9BACT|nr:metalloregulator ArsR/SmtB family transcription factor [Chitinophaga qingshengii]MBC9929180.1 winged helix-turn-helix transcriptional regulator [Chitinophaga qingshengii]